MMDKDFILFNMDINEKKILDNCIWSERVIKKYKNLYNNIVNYCNFAIKFNQKVYNYYHNINVLPTCKVCDSGVKFFNGKYSVYCSSKCSNIDNKSNRKDTMISKYGVNSFISKSEVREKIINTNLKKYGVDNPSKTELVKKKISESKIDLSIDDKNLINSKRAKSTLDKYGVDNVSKLDNIKEKAKDTNIKKWGYKSPIINEDIKEKRRINYIKKTGYSHHFKIEDNVKNMQVSRTETMKLKYLSKLSNLGIEVKNYKEGCLEILCTNCNKSFKIITYVLYQRISEKRILCTNCNPLYNKTSSYQLDIIKLLEDNNIFYIKNDREILNGKELDIYIPSKQLAIEINGLYWHSELYKDKKYHVNKTDSCRKLGIKLIHIWEDDWLYRNEICKSYLLNCLGIIKNKIFARKCEIRVVKDTNIVREFLNKNHLQGYSSSSIKLGLYFNEELISLMTFGWRNTNSKKEYELIRFCNKINYNILGAGSKLFNFFKSNFDYKSIISYSDESLFSGQLYEKLGFKYSHRSDPNYYWIVDGIRKHRFNYNKKKLVSNGYDPSKSEVNIMHDLGYYRIWGCGQKKWIYDANL